MKLISSRGTKENVAGSFANISWGRKSIHQVCLSSRIHTTRFGRIAVNVISLFVSWCTYRAPLTHIWKKRFIRQVESLSTVRTSLPSWVLFSSATLPAREIAATRRGWVMAMMPCRPMPASYRYWGIWVVFPEPVSPDVWEKVGQVKNSAGATLWIYGAEMSFSKSDGKYLRFTLFAVVIQKKTHVDIFRNKFELCSTTELTTWVCFRVDSPFNWAAQQRLTLELTVS